jgi:RNA polymerase sigma factor (sigma-70 family)
MGAPEEFIAVYEREAESILVFFARRTWDAEVALDLTAETFAQVWRGWSGVRTGSAEEVRALLFTIARRQLGRYARRGRVERRALQRLRAVVPTLHEDDLIEVERAAGLAELRASLTIELAKLSSDQRDALQLRIVQELSYQEIAGRLGISQPTARARVSRGLRALADVLEPASAQEAKPYEPAHPGPAGTPRRA